MTILKNNRHELFAQAIVRGMSQTAAAIQAGYKKSRARQTAHELVTKSDILDRILELAVKTETSTVMTVKERKERLSDIAKEDIQGQYEAKRHPNISAIAELNKMGGDYAPSKVEVDPGGTLGPMLLDLLSRLRGYGKSAE